MRIYENKSHLILSKLFNELTFAFASVWCQKHAHVFGTILKQKIRCNVFLELGFRKERCDRSRLKQAGIFQNDHLRAPKGRDVSGSSTTVFKFQNLISIFPQFHGFVTGSMPA